MAVTGDGLASKTLEASQHHQGPLLELFLTPSMSNLTFWEVVDCILQENWCASERSLNYLLARHACTRQELDDLTKVHGESDKSSRKRIKEIDLRCKELESLRGHISYYESHLGQDPLEDDTPDDDGLFGHGAQARVATSQELTTLLQRTPQLKPLIHLQLKAKPMSWRWMMRVLTPIQLAPSPMRKMNC